MPQNAKDTADAARVSDEQIGLLLLEAENHGDPELQAMCHRALGATDGGGAACYGDAVWSAICQVVVEFSAADARIYCADQLGLLS